MSNVLKYDYNRIISVLLRHSKSFTKNDLIAERRICNEEVVECSQRFCTTFCGARGYLFILGFSDPQNR